jgi:hypothetical protein
MNFLKIIPFVPLFFSTWISVMIYFSSLSHNTEPIKLNVSRESPRPFAGFDLSPPGFPAAGNRPDIILSSYRDAISRDSVVDFFTGITKSGELAAIILTNADAFNISPSLAFALCWEESRYNYLAVNQKNRNESVDRGLFQLNCFSFPKLREEDFFNPSINAYYGMAHLRWCIDTGGTTIAGLAMYNAGTTRVRQDNTPKNTLDYISRVLEYQSRVEEFFRSEYVMAISMSPR